MSDDEKDDYKEDPEENYEDFFRKQGEQKSKKLCCYLMDKVLLFGTDYRNPQRIIIMNRLKILKRDYEKVFNKSLV